MFLWTGSEETFQMNAETSAVLIDDITLWTSCDDVMAVMMYNIPLTQFLFSSLQFPCYNLLIKAICWLFIFPKSLETEGGALSFVYLIDITHFMGNIRLFLQTRESVWVTMRHTITTITRINRCPFIIVTLCFVNKTCGWHCKESCKRGFFQ